MKNVLLFAPHYDDESIGCGGTLAKHVKRGDQVSVVFMTSGNSGSTLDDNLSQTEYGKLRQEESTAAMKVLGINDFQCLGLEEGFMRFTPELEKELIKIIRDARPQIVYAPNADESHNDHLVTSLAVTQAAHKARWTYFPQLGITPFSVSEIRLYEIWTPLQRPNLFVDITDMIALKETAIKLYKSQLIHHQHHNAALALNRYRGLTSAGVEFAEAFKVEKLYELD